MGRNPSPNKKLSGKTIYRCVWLSTQSFAASLGAPREEWITISPFVIVKNGNIAIETLALLDTGCETSLITQELAKELR